MLPADNEVRPFLASQQREHDWAELIGDADASYDIHEEIDLGAVEPLIGTPSSPGNVRPVREVAGMPIYPSRSARSLSPRSLPAFIGSFAHETLPRMSCTSLFQSREPLEHRETKAGGKTHFRMAKGAPAASS